MRLIDADKLKKEIHCTYSDDLEIIEKIENQPTAFDVEKVIEEFENLREVELHMCDELVVGDADAQYNDGVSQGRYEAFIEAIEIVKRGGRDEE